METSSSSPKSPWQIWKEKNLERQQSGVVRPYDFINPDTPMATEDVAMTRLLTCGGCPKYTVTNQCTECGCYMPAKVKLFHASCPMGKW